jgi:hypothetical protein
LTDRSPAPLWRRRDLRPRELYIKASDSRVGLTGLMILLAARLMLLQEFVEEIADIVTEIDVTVRQVIREAITTGMNITTLAGVVTLLAICSTVVTAQHRIDLRHDPPAEPPAHCETKSEPLDVLCGFAPTRNDPLEQRDADLAQEPLDTPVIAREEGTRDEVRTPPQGSLV